MRSKWILASLLLALVVGMTVTVAAQEAEQSGRGPAVQGEVEAKTQSSLSIRSAQGVVELLVNADTRYQVPGVARPTFADVLVGDRVLALGGRDDSGFWLARLVKVLPPIPIYGLKGEVKVVEDRLIVIETADGDRSVVTDDNTRYRVPGVEHPTMLDVHVGDAALVVVESQTDGTLLAKSIAVLPDGMGGPAIVRGRVVAISRHGLRLATGKRQVALSITEQTRFWVPRDQTPNLSDLEIGDWVLAIARPRGGRSLEAIAIGLLPPVSAHRYVVRGVVVATDGATLTVQDTKDVHSVSVSADTRIVGAGAEQSKVADIGVGATIVAAGKPKEGAKEGEGHALEALVIIIGAQSGDTLEAAESSGGSEF